jgi:hypothetical protein
MRKKQGKRAPIPIDNEASVLTRSRRRCALCFGLEMDLGVKEVQIAHVNRKRSDCRVENLAALCLPHHNLYDSTFRQTKGFKPEELLGYRTQLYEVLDKRDTTVIGTLVGDNGSRTEAPTNARRLGEVAEAFDEDFARIDRPNGIRLATLGCTFIRQDGDFIAARETMRALGELSDKMAPSEIESASIFLSARNALSRASPPVSMIEILHAASEKDGILAISLVNGIVHRALYGEKKNFTEFNLDHCPGTFLQAAMAILGGIIRCIVQPSPPWFVELAIREAANLFCRASIAYRLRGYDIPSSISARFLSGSGNRVRPGKGFIGPGGVAPEIPSGNFPPDDWFKALDTLAGLPESLFQKALDSVASKAFDWTPLLKDGGSVSGASGKDALTLMSAWTTVIGGAWVTGQIVVEGPGEFERVLSIAVGWRDAANEALSALRTALMDEHGLILAHN